MVIGSFVLGLRPSRSERSRRSNDPNPTSVIFSPFATASVTTSKKAQILNLATTYTNKLLQIKNSRTRLASASNEALLLPSSDKEIFLLKFLVTSQS